MPLLSSKVWYFWSYAAAAFIIPFLNLYFQRLGFSKEQIGLLTALRPWLSAISGNVFAVAADHLAAHRIMLLVTYVATALLRFSLSTVSSFGVALALVVLMEIGNSPINIIVDAAVMRTGGESGFGRARLWGAVGWGCSAPLAGAVVARCGIRTAFLCNLVLAVVGFVPTVLLPIGRQRPLTRAASGQLDAQEKSPQEDTAGCEIGGSSGELQVDADAHAAAAGLGDGDASPPSVFREVEGSPLGAQAELPGSLPGGHMRRDDTSVWEVAAHVPFISAPEFLVYDLHTASWLASQERPHASESGEPIQADTNQPNQCSVDVKLGSEEPHFAFHDVERGVLTLEEPLLLQDMPKASELSLVQKAALVLSNPEAITFFCIAVLMGYGMGTIDSFLFLFLDELGGSELLMGLTITVTCVAEVPVFFFTSWLLETLGVNVVLHGVLAVYILRLAFYSILQHLVTPWAVLPIELLHGVTFGLAWASGTINCSRISPPGLETTTQAIFQGLFLGVGLGLGGLVGGLVYHNFGALIVFASAAAVLAAGLCLCMLVQALVAFRCRCSRGKA